MNSVLFDAVDAPLTFPTIAMPVDKPKPAPAPVAPRADLPAVVLAQPGDAPASETADELVDRAEISNGKALIKLSKSEHLVANLRAEHEKMTYSMATTKDAKETRRFRANCVALRSSIEDHCLMLRRPAITFGKDVLAAEKLLVAEIKRIEAFSDSVIVADEKAKKEAKEKAEREAKQKNDEIDATIKEITSRVEDCIDQPASFIGETITWLDNTEITDEDFGDRAAETRAAVQTTRDRLVSMKAKAEADEVAAANAKILADKLKAQQEELDRREADLKRREAIAERIETLRTLPDELVVAGAQQLREAIARAEALTEEDYGNRLSEAQSIADGVLPQLRDLLEEASQEEEQAPEDDAPAAAEQETVDTGFYRITGGVMGTIEAAEPTPFFAAPAPAPAPEPEPVAEPAQAPIARSSTGFNGYMGRPAAVLAQTTRPSDAQLIEVLALHYRVGESTVITWLQEMDLFAESTRITEADAIPF